VWKKAHVSFDDNRIFDVDGRLMANSYHFGKNPYGFVEQVAQIPTDPRGEWESICYIAGYQGMPDLKVRPKAVSMHGRQRILDASGDTTICTVAKLSRLKSMSIRSNLAVFAGDEEHEPTYNILVDLVGRTIQIVNDKEERIAVFTKSEKTLIMNAAFGIGSEFTIDVAQGVDWTTILAICIGLHQVGKHYAKDAFNNFLVQPVEGKAIDYAVAEGAAALDGDLFQNSDGEGDGQGDLGGDQGGDQGSDQGGDQGGDQGSDQGGDQGSDQGGDDGGDGGSASGDGGDDGGDGSGDDGGGVVGGIIDIMSSVFGGQ
jgi:hypothetical protein